MATIGTFKKDGTGYSGQLETLTMRAVVTFCGRGLKTA
jgi:uncharacterized protein (DUF736 family)